MALFPKKKSPYARGNEDLVEGDLFTEEDFKKGKVEENIEEEIEEKKPVKKMQRKQKTPEQKEDVERILVTENQIINLKLDEMIKELGNIRKELSEFE